MSGGNLIRKKNQLLINSLASGDVAVSDGKLFIKQYGNEIALNNITHYARVDHVAATKKVSLIECKPIYPTNDDLGYDGGITIQRDYQFTGDPQSFYGHSKSYTYYLENLRTASSGYLNEIDRAEMVGNIVEMINADPYAVAEAKSRYYIAYTGSGTMAVNDLRGDVVLESATVADVSAAVTALNAVTGITAVADSTSGVIVEASEGLVFTLESGKWAYGASSIQLTQSENRYPFSVFMNNGFGTETISTAFVKEIIPLREVQQIFPILPVSSVGATPNIPIQNTDYSKCIFYVEHNDAAGLVGASRKETFEEVVEIFMPTTVMNGAYWADVLYPYLIDLGLITVELGKTSLVLTGASGAGAGTMSVDDVPGFTVSSVKYYAGGSNTGTINVTTGVVANGTDADVFYAEIKYAHLGYLVVSEITCTAVATGSFSGKALDATEILTYSYLGRWDLVTNTSGLGTPVLRDFGVNVLSQQWAFGTSNTGVCNSLTGTITTAGAADDVFTGNVLYEGKTTVTSFKHVWITNKINSQTIVSVAS